MATWKEILADSKSYPDDFAIQLANGQTVTLGSARAYDKENEGALTQKLTARERELAERESKVNQASAAVGELWQRYSEVTGMSLEDVAAGKQPTRKEMARSAGLSEDDPLVGELVKETKALRTLAEQQATELKNLKERGLAPVVNQYLNDYYESKWEKVSATLPKKAQESLKFEDVLKHANDAGLKDRSGRLDLARAAKELSFDYLVEERTQAELAKERQRQADSDTMAAIQPPVSGNSPRFGTPQNFKNDKGMTKSFDEVLRDAAQDRELWTSVARGNA